LAAKAEMAVAMTRSARTRTSGLPVKPELLPVFGGSGGFVVGEAATTVVGTDVLVGGATVFVGVFVAAPPTDVFVAVAGTLVFVGVRVAVDVLVGAGVNVLVAPATWVFVAVGVRAHAAPTHGVAVAAGIAVFVGVAVLVGVFVGPTGVLVGVAVLVAVAVGVLVGTSPPITLITPPTALQSKRAA